MGRRRLAIDPRIAGDELELDGFEKIRRAPARGRSPDPARRRQEARRAARLRKRRGRAKT